ncbi:hypothetical protein L5515_006352 [Caenorhabditis briggsae]|uniref:Uncharacterized protein n=1 Tax=Caenorhabditis briggsae TaxID=6238 RepID=A0AAE9EZ85_CAEBR|nr:hypothetical protein L5515_006352 [Caenorhabditis briggsae]
MLSFTVILFSILISQVSSAGHLQLDLTSSTDCSIRIVSNILNADVFKLTAGEERTIIYHPLLQHDTIEIALSIGPDSTKKVYYLKKGTQREVLTFNDVAIFVEASFKCDKGFTGSKCLRSIKDVQNQRVQDSTTTTTTSTTLIPFPINTEETISTENLLILIFAIVMIILLSGFPIAYFLTKPKTNRTISCDSLEIKKADSSLDSGISIGSPRYTVEPSNIFVV